MDTWKRLFWCVESARRILCLFSSIIWLTWMIVEGKILQIKLFSGYTWHTLHNETQKYFQYIYFAIYRQYWIISLSCEKYMYWKFFLCFIVKIIPSLYRETFYLLFEVTPGLHPIRSYPIIENSSNSRLFCSSLGKATIGFSNFSLGFTLKPFQISTTPEITLELCHESQ